MISKPKPLQKLTIDKTPQPKISEEEESDEEVINDADIKNYILPPDISNFRDIPLGHFTFFDLTGHLITTFEGINRFPSLKKLILKKTLISSFKGSSEMPNLEEIDFTETPLSRRFYCREMALFALGFQIRVINNIPVTQTELNLSSLNTRASIESSLQRGYFITSYPNSNSVSSFTAQNLGFCSPKTASEISDTFTEYNNKYEQMKRENPKYTVSINDMANEIYYNANAFRRARNNFINQCKWFGLQNIHYSSQTEEVEDLRLQIQGLKPSSSYMRHLNDLSSIQKQDSEFISSLEDENEKIKKTFSEHQKSLRLATEMNFNLQLKIKNAKSGKFDSFEEQIQSMQNEINSLKAKEAELQEANSNLKNEMNIYESNCGKYQNEFSGVLQAAESMKKDKEASKRSISSLEMNDKKQKTKIEELKNSLKLKNDENEKLEKQLQELNKEIEEMKLKKDEVEKKIAKNRLEFDQKMNEISKL